MDWDGRLLGRHGSFLNDRPDEAGGDPHHVEPGLLPGFYLGTAPEVTALERLAEADEPQALSHDWS